MDFHEWVYGYKSVWGRIVEIYPELCESNNIYASVDHFFKRNFSKFWSSFKADYMDTLMHWNMAGAFIGQEEIFYSEDFWESLDERMDQNGMLKT
jgi:hypothetical protein